MADRFEIVSPVDQRVYAQLPYGDSHTVQSKLESARAALAEWRRTPLAERAELMRALVQAMQERREAVALDVAWQMGRPLWQADETARLVLNTDKLIEDAEAALATREITAADGIRRFVSAEPAGVVLSICAWNYPVAMASSLIVAPLLAGNTVLFKHAPQTALIGDHFAAAAVAAGLPEGVFQSVHLTHADVAKMIGSGHIDVVQFIGSTQGGQAVYDAGRSTFTRYCLELGGKDASYVRADAEIEKIVADLVEGSFGNAGQSCCSVERIYVHESRYARFLEAFVAAAKEVTLGHPIEERTYIGPVVSASAASRINELVREARARGARALLSPRDYAVAAEGTAYVPPQILADATHDMRIMREETFGPVVAVMPVRDDQDAIARMNDSVYGLTASIWTADIEQGARLGEYVQCGTFYVNRCDHADMNLPWGGVGRSGIGRSYSHEGFEDLVVRRAHHIRRLR